MFCHVDSLDQLPLFNVSDKVPQFSALEVDADLVECALNNPVLMIALLITFLTHPETVIGLCDLTILNKIVKFFGFL